MRTSTPTNTKQMMVQFHKNIKLSVFIVFLSVIASKANAQNCYGSTAAEMEFTSSGGNLQRTIQTPSGCSGGTWTIDGYPNWLTSIYVSGTIVYASAPAYSGPERGGQINLYLNGSVVGAIPVVQNKGETPPPPPCNISGFSNGNISSSGETKIFTLSYSNCPSNIYYTFKQLVNYTTEQDLPSWVNNITQNPTTKQITIQFDANTTTADRSVHILGKRQDGGSTGISGIFDQPCLGKNWYPDSDGDGLRDPGSTAVKDCAATKPGYTLITTIDACPNEPNTLAENVVKTWYRDTDGDGYKDPNGQTVQQCTKPSGGWTSNPQDDNCPNHAYGSNAGCDPNCDIDLPQDTLLDFGPQGGQLSITFGVPQNCSGYGLSFVNVPTWITDIHQSYNTIVVIADSSTEFREAGILVYSNGSIQGSIGVRQNYDPGPPDPPQNCEVSPIGNILLDSQGESRTVTVAFTNPDECSYPLYIKHPYNPSVGSWLEIDKQGNTFTLTVGPNDTGTQLTTPLIVVRDDGTGNMVSVDGGGFIVSQPSCLDQWYLDTDGDGLGDVYGSPRTQCTDPDDDPDDDPSDSWVSNNDDLCPYEPGTAQNHGCPEGSIPENRNTVTSLGFDLNENLKVGSKSYFDELGKLEQAQTWDVKSDSIWAAATLYDGFGRPALSTLSAPIYPGSSFLFKESFVKKADNSTDYSLVDYDGSNNEEPLPIGDGAQTLGWYYSENNDREGYQDITEYPFAKSVYSKLDSGKVLRTVGGNKINGQWPQSYTFSMKASGELSGPPAFGDNKYNDIGTVKTVMRDVHGAESVVFSDTDGKILAAARSGGSVSRTQTMAIGEQGHVDIHVPQGTNMGLTVSGSPAYTVYDMVTETTVTASTSLSNGFYRVAVDNLDTYVPGSLTVTYRENYYDYALNEYDKADRLIRSYQSLGTTKATKPFSTYEYNTLGQLIRTTSPDEGTAEFKYRRDGQIRFSRNSKQKDPNGDGNFADAEFSYTDYDTYGRPVESGVLESTGFGTALPDDGLPTGVKKEVVSTTYDALEPADIASLPTGYQNPGFLAGNVAKTQNDGSATYYSYDIYGRVRWIVQDITGLGIKTLDYTYDPVTGLVVLVDYQKDVPGERFLHRYTYNGGDQLTKVETSTNGNDYTVRAEYAYYETGGLKRTELAGGLQGVDYVYNLAGQLKSLNHPSLSAANDPGGDANDLFGMQLDYHTGDYRRDRANITVSPYGTDRSDGNIKGVRWKNGAVPGAVESEYSYSYDRNNWLEGAEFDPADSGTGLPVDLPLTGTVTGDHGASHSITVTDAVITPTTRLYIGGAGNGDYDVSNIAYDANGNILSLKRNKQDEDDGIAMDDLSYTYRPGTNQLLRVDDGEGDVQGADDIGDQNGENYVYNKIGQLVADVSEGIAYEYNTSGLVTRIKKNNLNLVTFFYNGRGHRIRKDTYDVTGLVVIQSTFYVRDVAGSVMAVYNNTTLAEQPVYGLGRIGVAYVETNNARSYVYELTDHLGNVRAAFAVNSGSPDAVNATDYYPGGMAMPNRDIVGDYRYNYQGQELDKETGKVAFELRLYDPRINRWLTTDPMGEFASPYLAMGNNWINRVDPTGGSTDCPDCPDPPIATVMLDEVVVTAGNGSWTSESTRYGYGGTFQMWQQEFNRSGSYLQELQNWEAEYGDTFRRLTAQWDKEEQNRRTLEKLAFFSGGFGTIGQIISPGSLPTARPFGFKGIYSPPKASLNYAEGSFSTFNWQGYPARGPKPTGPFRLLQGADYNASRAAANKINAALHRANPQLKGLHIHEIQPIKFAGSPTNLSNKLYLTSAEHAQYTRFWNSLMRSAQ